MSSPQGGFLPVVFFAGSSIIGFRQLEWTLSSRRYTNRDGKEIKAMIVESTRIFPGGRRATAPERSLFRPRALRWAQAGRWLKDARATTA
jgi:hypothetical protein